MAKKALNWTEIRARYESGEPPRSIAKDYKDCTAQKISEKASRAKWVQEKARKCQEIVNSVHESQKSSLEELCSLTEEIHLQALRRMTAKRPDGSCMMDDLNNALLFDGERVNGMFQTVLKNAVEIYKAKMRIPEPQGQQQAACVLEILDQGSPIDGPE